MIKYQVGLLLFLRRFKRVILLPGYTSSNVVLLQIIGMLRQNYRNYLPFSMAKLQPIFIALQMLRRILIHIFLRSFAIVYVQSLIANVFMQFESCHLHAIEDPSLFLWALEDILSKADPDLRDAAKQALLGIQFLRSLPNKIKLRLLEHDPTPKLTSMVEFVQHFHAVHGTAYERRAINHAFTTRDAVDSPQDSLRATVIDLTAAVAALTANQRIALLKDGGIWKAGKDMVYAFLIAISLATMRDPAHGRHSAACVLVGAIVKKSVPTLMHLMDQQPTIPAY